MAKMQSVINAALLGIVVLVVLFQTFALVVPTAQTQGSNMNDTNRCTSVGCGYNNTYLPADGTSCYNTSVVYNSTHTGICTNNLGQGIPLGNLFDGTGVIFVIVMASLLLLVVKGFLKKGK